jgi:diguanylate cyclase (GGDEF)-like protein/PAS domain S-box-containing protein
MHLQRGSTATLEEISKQFLERDPSLLAIRLVQLDGKVISEFREKGNSDQRNLEDDKSVSRIAASLHRMGRPWATLEFCYAEPATWGLAAQIFIALGIALSVNFPLFAHTLGRSLSVIDTSRVVPQRVRNTLDTLPDGIAITDSVGRVIVVNEAFQKGCRKNADEIIGVGLNSLALQAIQDVLPWNHEEKNHRFLPGVKVFLKHDDGVSYFKVGSSPIFDASDKHAGNLISFQDITELENQKMVLESTLKELGESQEKLCERNAQLQEIATKDMLTGVNNRRFLIEQFEVIWHTCSTENRMMSVIMLDVDRFKLLNDNHGHAVGDRVLRDVADVLKRGVLGQGIVARYGGEEFCCILPDLDSAQATAVAESIRGKIEAELALPYHVTASFGVSSREFHAVGYQEMLEQADQALYAAKHGGRNAVCCWNLAIGQKEKAADKKAASKDSGKQEKSYLSISAIRSSFRTATGRDQDRLLRADRVAKLCVAFGRKYLSSSQLNQLEAAALLRESINWSSTTFNQSIEPVADHLSPEKIDRNSMTRQMVALMSGSREVADILYFENSAYRMSKASDSKPMESEVPLSSRILAVVAAFDQLRYRKDGEELKTEAEALEGLAKSSGMGLDPVLVTSFIEYFAQTSLIEVGSDDSNKEAALLSHPSEALKDRILEKIDEIMQLTDVADHRMSDAAVASLNSLLQRFQSTVSSSSDDHLAAIDPLVADMRSICAEIKKKRSSGNKNLSTETTQDSFN